MKSLKPKIRLKINQGYSVREVSEMLNVPIDYVLMVFLEIKYKYYGE